MKSRKLVSLGLVVEGRRLSEHQSNDHGSLRPNLVRLWLLLSNVVAPLSESLDNFRQDGSSKWDSEEDEGLVYKIGQTKLCPDC